MSKLKESEQFQFLIIDDDKNFRRLLTLRLRSFFPGAQIREFDSLADVRSFLEGLQDESVELVILDQHLPDGKGTDLLREGWFHRLAVLSVSSDDTPSIPGESLKAGAAYFLRKTDVSEDLFEPLVRGILDRNRMQQALTKANVDRAVIDTVKRHIGTLRHEINNPLGAVLGAAFVLRNNPAASEDQKEAARLVEESGKRIKYVLDQIIGSMESHTPLEEVTKADTKVFRIPGDEPWEES